MKKKIQHHFEPFPYIDFKSAMKTLTTTLAQKTGYTLLLGESGTGKTTLLRTLSKQLDRSQFQLIYLCHGRISPSTLTRVLADTLHLPLRRTQTETSRMLTHFLRNHPIHLLIWIDEAQLISDETLHDIRMMAEADLDSAPLFSVIFSSLPSLKERFLSPNLFPLWRRISPKLVLSGLLAEECQPFLEHSFSKKQIERFSKEALNIIFEQARGIPALLQSFTQACFSHQEKGQMNQNFVSEIIETIETL